MNNEEWRDVLGYEGLYAVSSLGRVKSVQRVVMRSNGSPQTIRERVMSTSVGGHGYPDVRLFRGGRGKTWTVHRLVADAFHGPKPFANAEIRHLDGTRTNNHADNLRWGTASENAQDTLRHGKNPHAIKTECYRGHPYTAENTLAQSKGGRACRACASIRNDKRRARERRERELQRALAYPDLAYAVQKGGLPIGDGPTLLADEPTGDAMRWTPQETT